MDYRNYIFTNGEKLKVGTMYCIGRNYADHAREMGAEVPKSPLVFIKPPAAYVPDGAVVALPSFSEDVHHEVELVAIIGKDGRDIPSENAYEYIEGFAVGIDLTLRDVQSEAKKKGAPWAVAKGFHNSAPISNIVPFYEIGKADYDFDLELKVNGETRQKGNTSFMERPLSLLIEYLSGVFTLRKGDCIFTGTPKGVGQVVSGDIITADLSGMTSLEVKLT